MDRTEKIYKRVIGIDSHPDSFTGAVVTGTNARTSELEMVSDQLRLEQLPDWCERHVVKEHDVIVFEASANTFALAATIISQGYCVAVLDSRAVGRVTSTYNLNDKVCAERVARAWLGGQSDAVWIPDEKTRLRRQVLTAHDQAVTDSTRAINRIKSLLNEWTVRLSGRHKLTTKTARQRLLKLHNWNPQQKLLIEEAHQSLLDAEARRQRWRQEMARDLFQQADFMQLMRLFGVSLITAYALMAVIGDIRRFPTHKKLASYLGLAPSHKQSGNSMKTGGIVHQGPRQMRAKLVQAGQAILNCSGGGTNRLHRWGWSLCFRKNRQLAVIAVAHKLVTAVWYLLHGRPFNAEEETDALRSKFHYLAKELKISFLRELGYQSYQHFIDALVAAIHQKSGDLLAMNT